MRPARFQPDEASIEALTSAIDLKSIIGLSFETTNPRRFQNSAASVSTALTTNARPPIKPAAVTQRCNACLSRPVPMPLPSQF